MERLIESTLNEWRQQARHLPLIIRGARQIGKSYTVEKFGRQYFDDTVIVNFELSPPLKSAFSNLDPHKILSIIELATSKRIVPGKTLLFLDEIQECPEAIMALRYFKEKIPELHVIAAGSLLEFALHSDNFRMPVGRVQFMYMKPLCFKEFLMALGEPLLKEFIEKIEWQIEVPEIIHHKLLDYIRLYFTLGGMPAVVENYIETKSLLSAKRIQLAILSTYRSDFGKYAKFTRHQYLEKLFIKAPELIAQQFRYANVSREIESRYLKEALDNLNKAGLVYSVYSTNASGLPLKALINPKKFKLLFVDIGLASSAIQPDMEFIPPNDTLLVTRGALAEQFVGQELLANQDYYIEPDVFYWSRDTRGSQAEIDYVINIGHTIIPVEVKAGSTGRMKSLHIFMEKYKSALGIRISSLPLQYSSHTKNKNGIISIPFYLISELKRVLL